jgi:hypothetical protein
MKFIFAMTLDAAAGKAQSQTLMIRRHFTRFNGRHHPSATALGTRYGSSANRRRQQGHSPSNPRTSDRNADGWGSVVIAFLARGAR